MCLFFPTITNLETGMAMHPSRSTRPELGVPVRVRVVRVVRASRGPHHGAYFRAGPGGLPAARELDLLPSLAPPPPPHFTASKPPLCLPK